MKNLFSKRLYLLRTELGVSRAQLAKSLNISTRLISYWENGQRECSFDMLLALANLFEVSTDFLLGKTEY